MACRATIGTDKVGGAGKRRSAAPHESHASTARTAAHYCRRLSRGAISATCFQKRTQSDELRKPEDPAPRVKVTNHATRKGTEQGRSNRSARWPRLQAPLALIVSNWPESLQQNLHTLVPLCRARRRGKSPAQEEVHRKSAEFVQGAVQVVPVCLPHRISACKV